MVKCSGCGEERAVLVYEGAYCQGDTITFATDAVNCHYVVRVDDTMDEALVYITKPEVVYAIPFDEKKVSYNPKSFTGEKHYLTIRTAEAYETGAYRNLAKNVMDQHGIRTVILMYMRMWRPEEKRCSHAMPLTAWFPTNPTANGRMNHGD